ncbi:MAG: aldehyde dehydrogenase family protein [Alphaproteobacteria bacterium]|nr:aldehyde dehydrogenase family protein [Alphaproteobacteria bacterium]MBU2083494.1 aldehyde dehydrogenase family protein [Alphaproteobacteria bacterium]MBU2143540.1 aldehyde dehydrogenase family protein [Alphaproteobacteria bacterium]MBU2196059.1 aldehyde dehydrogenase family protein [Alphaproteobacteria bacterium]
MSSTHFSMTINGQAINGTETFAVENPATGKAFANAPDCTQAELDAAVAAARAAFPGWKATPIAKRRELLNAMAGVIMQNLPELSRLLTQEQGKPHPDAEGDVGGGAFWLMESSKHEIPEHVSEDSAERHAVTRYGPIGVVAAIVPWNFPIILAAFKLGPALLAGNTVVLKPAPTTPLTTLRIGELLRGVLPDGVLNVISGSDRLGPWLTAHPGVDKVSFTGSTQTGKKVMESAAHSLKRVTLELGGNDPAIVMPDVDVEKVAEDLFWAAFRNTGQICIATKRMYIHKDVYEPLKAALVAYAKTVKVGDGAEQGTQIGPIQNSAQYKRVLELIQDAKDNGYKFLIGGEASDVPGYFVPITILDNPPENARIVQEEQFGPVLPLLKFDNLDEVVGRANDSEYGLGASIWSSDIARAQEIATSLQAGTVWINESQHLSPHAAFGGFKQSGIGVEGGQEGVLEFCQAQTVFTRKPQPAT